MQIHQAVYAVCCRKPKREQLILSGLRCPGNRIHDCSVLLRGQPGNEDIRRSWPGIRARRTVQSIPGKDAFDVGRSRHTHGDMKSSE